MERRVLNNPLDEQQTKDAARVNLFFLVKSTLAQHPEDGGIEIPAGRWVMVVPDKSPAVPDEYLCQELFVATPGTNDVENQLKDMLRLRSRRGFRVLVVPKGGELEYFKAVAKSSGLRQQRSASP